MRLLINYATLIRLPNILIVILTEWLLYRYVLIPAYELTNIEPTLNADQIFLLALVTAFLTAGGYIINDIIDFNIDLHNRPKKVIISKQISTEVAYLLYFSLSVFGFVLAIYLALKTNNLHLVFLYPSALLGLYFYSHLLKKWTAVDNLVVSFYCAGVAAIVGVAERHSIRQLIADHPEIAKKTLFIFSMYLVFAFLTTFIREIIKDMEDMAGDQKHGCSSIPIFLGLHQAKVVVYILGIFLIGSIGYAFYYLQETLGFLQQAFMVFVIIIPILIELYELSRAKTVKDFHRLSTFAKLTMLAGIFFIVITSF